MQDQVQYLETLLKGLRERYAKGEKDLADKIRHTAAKLEELKLKENYKEEQVSYKNILDKVPLISLFRRGCCGGRG